VISPDDDTTEVNLSDSYEITTDGTFKHKKHGIEISKRGLKSARGDSSDRSPENAGVSAAVTPGALGEELKRPSSASVDYSPRLRFDLSAEELVEVGILGKGAGGIVRKCVLVKDLSFVGNALFLAQITHSLEMVGCSIEMHRRVRPQQAASARQGNLRRVPLGCRKSSQLRSCRS
jgi:hypothetical protein